MPARHPKANKRKRQPDRRPRELPRGVHRRSATVVIYLLFTGLSLTLFSQTIHYNFVNFDDDMYVYNAPAIRAGLTLKGIAAAFTSPHAGNWHPLTTLSHMLDCGLYGLNAGGHHATNAVLHTIAALLLFGVLRQMTGALWKSASFLRTLAAAYAESGRFSEAFTVAQQAAAIARMQGKTGLANRLETDLMGYRGRLPLRQNSLGD